MEMQITADFSQLTAEQREHLAGFILTFPPIPEGMVTDYAEARNAMGDTEIHIHVEPDAPVTDDPAVAFGAQASVTQAGPTLVIPPPPAIHEATMQDEARIPPVVTQGTVIGLDKHGLPWDARIHASTKAVSADGSWRKKRGLDAAVLAQVEAELKALMAIPAGPQLVPTPPPPPPAASNVPPPPPSTHTEDPRAAFVALVGRASAAMQAKKITEEEIKGCCKSVDPNIVSLPLLAARPDLIPQVAALIDGIIAGRNA